MIMPGAQPTTKGAFVILRSIIAAIIICGSFLYSSAEEGIIIEEIDEEVDTVDTEKPAPESAKPAAKTRKAEESAEAPAEVDAPAEEVEGPEDVQGPAEVAGPQAETPAETKAPSEATAPDTTPSSPEAALQPAIEKPAEGEETEIYEYDGTRDGYYSPGEKRPAAATLTPHAKSAPLSPADNTLVAYSSEAPARPIGKTIVGIILTANGTVGTIFGVITMISIGSSGGSPALAMPFLGAGLGELIPGAALLSTAKNEWNIYNEWERANKGRAGLPAFKMQLVSIEF
jgi:outer membrane biosynthesis protein TonB